MKKLGVKADVGKDMRALFQGDSTQVPMLSVVNIGKARISRKISLGNRALVYEKISERQKALVTDLNHQSFFN